jgi:HAD superfamily hydrolase (TIGR01509 family)
MPLHLDIPPGDFAGYIFDLDGTLIDSMPLHYRAWDAAMRDCGLQQPLDEDLFYSLGGVPTQRVAELLGAHYGLKVDQEKVTVAKEGIYRDWLPRVQLIEPVATIARRVAVDHQVAIATGGAPDVARPALVAAGLEALFKIVITPLDVPPGRGKPAPDMFLLAAQRMGVPPERCLVFEDAEPGIVGARAAGMTVVRVPSRTARPRPEAAAL